MKGLDVMPRHTKPLPAPSWDDPALKLVDKIGLAKEMEVTPPAVTAWVKRGLPVRADGLIDLKEAARWVLANLDPVNASQTRRVARDVLNWLWVLTSERQATVITVERAGAAAYQSALAAGVADPAGLADATLRALVPMLNDWLDGECNVPLAEPPPGVWRQVLESCSPQPEAAPLV